MSNRAYAETLMAELGRVMDLDWLRLDEQNRCGIVFEGNTAVEIEYKGHNHTLMLLTDLGPVHSDDPVNLYRLVLSANLNGEEAAPVLALEAESGSLIQFTTLYLFNIDNFSKFESILENFVHTALDWQARINGRPACPIEDDTPAGATDGQGSGEARPLLFQPGKLA